MFCAEVSQLLATRFLLSCSLLLSDGVRCWALALLLSPSHLLCTCSFVSFSFVVWLSFSLGCSCKERASCRIMLRWPERGRQVTSPETRGAAVALQCFQPLLLPCRSRWLILFSGSLPYYLPRWAPGAGGQSPPGSIRLLEELECQGEGFGHWTPLSARLLLHRRGCFPVPRECHFPGSWTFMADPRSMTVLKPVA